MVLKKKKSFLLLPALSLSFGFIPLFYLFPFLCLMLETLLKPGILAHPFVLNTHCQKANYKPWGHE